MMNKIIDFNDLSASCADDLDEDDYVMQGKETKLDNQTMQRLSDEHARNLEKLRREGQLISVKDFCLFR